MDSVQLEITPPVAVVAIKPARAAQRVDPDTAAALREAFAAVDADDSVHAAVFTGRDGCFCAGYDLQAFSEAGGTRRTGRIGPRRAGPDGPQSAHPGKPTIAAVEATRWPAVWNSRSGATSGWLRRTPSSECSVDAGACRSSTAALCGCPG